MNKTERMLRDLLAVIHCDGGHTTERLGLDGSFNEAIETRNQQIIRLEELEAENARMRDAITTMYNASGYCILCYQHEHSEKCILKENDE